MEENIIRVQLANKTIILLGTVHVSSESVREVRELIANEKPMRVCVEIDERRWASLDKADSWDNLDILKVLKTKQGLLMLVSLVLSSFQRRIGGDEAVRPGSEMLAAVRAAQEAGLAYSFCDRDIQITLKRAWESSGFFGKTKLLATLLSAAFSREKMSQDEIENLKSKGELEEMMAALSSAFPKAKQVLIDERDRYLAAKIFQSSEEKVLAVLGAGHLTGVSNWLGKFDAGESSDIADLETTQPPNKIVKALGFLIPALLVGILAYSFVALGTVKSVDLLLRWILINGSLAALGSALCLAHPVTIIASMIGAPLATLNPFISIGMIAGVVEAVLKKPRVKDIQNLSLDVTKFRTFYSNRITHILLVFFLSSLGGMIGNLIALPLLASNIFG